MHIHVGLVRVVPCLLHVEVRCGSVEVHVGERPDRTLRSVGSHADTIRGRNGRNLPRLGNPTARVDVRLSEIDQVALQVGCKTVDGLHPFACRDRRRGMGTEVGPVFDVIHLNWFFDEEQVAILDAAHEVQDVRSRHRPGTMNGQFVVLTAGLAKLVHVLDHPRDRSLRPSDAADGVAVGLGLLPGFGRDAAASVVALDPVVDRAPQELIDGLSQRLAKNVPRGRINRADCRRQGAAAQRTPE